jgi:hypothetical protein
VAFFLAGASSKNDSRPTHSSTEFLGPIRS